MFFGIRDIHYFCWINTTIIFNANIVLIYFHFSLQPMKTLQSEPNFCGLTFFSWINTPLVSWTSHTHHYDVISTMDLVRTPVGHITAPNQQRISHSHTVDYFKPSSSASKVAGSSAKVPSWFKNKLHLNNKIVIQQVSSIYIKLLILICLKFNIF